MTPPRHRLPLLLVAGIVAVAAYAIRLAVLLQTGGLLGSSAYDDGVYYAAATAFAHGRWPYADFLFLQPPGVLLAGAPFAALGAAFGDPTGVLVARLAWIGIGAANCVLVAVIAGRRSWQGALVGGAFAACLFPLAYGERSTLLEPLCTLLLLVAVLLRERGGARAAVVAGIAAGVSVDVKIWCIVPALVLVAFPPHRLRFLIGAVAGGAVVVAPFLIRSPDGLVRQVLLDQLGRPDQPGDTVVGRFVVITGGQYSGGADDVPLPASLVVAAVVAAVALAAAVAACRTPLGRRAVALLVATTAVLLASPSFLAHYSAFTGPWIALVLGVGTGEAIGRIRIRALAGAAGVLLAAGAAAPTLERDLQPAAKVASVAPIAAAAARVDGCVRSDDPGLLAAIGTLSRDLGRGCEVWPDVTGWTYERPGFPVVTADRPGSAVWQRFVTRYLLSGDAVIVDRSDTGLSEASRRRIAALPVLARSGDLVLHAVPR